MSRSQPERSTRSSNFHPEVLLTNLPAYPQDSDRNVNDEAHARTNLSLDSVPPTLSLRTTNSLSTSTSPRLFSDTRCSDCSPNAPLLLDENQLMQKGILSFMQLLPCGHTYCTSCFESILVVSTFAGASTFNYRFNLEWMVLWEIFDLGSDKSIY